MRKNNKTGTITPANMAITMQMMDDVPTLMDVSPYVFLVLLLVIHNKTSMKNCQVP